MVIMPKRKTVSIKVDVILNLVASNDWSAAAFARKIGKHDRWFSEVKRNRNLPSPEEAARMCAILNVTPEEILTEPEDVELVTGLIKAEAAKTGQIEREEKPLTQKGKELNPKFDYLTSENKDMVNDLIEKLLKSQSSD